MDDKKQYPAADINFSVIQKEYEYELNRSVKLDNKINMTITICGVLFIFIFKFLNFKEIFNSFNDSLAPNVLYFIQSICAFGNIIVFSLFVYCVIKLILLLKSKGYYHFNCDDIFDNDLMSECKENCEYFIAVKYWSATYQNNITNEKRSKDYNKILWSLCAMLLFCIITIFIKINILGLGV